MWNNCQNWCYCKALIRGCYDYSNVQVYNNAIHKVHNILPIFLRLFYRTLKQRVNRYLKDHGLVRNINDHCISHDCVCENDDLYYHSYTF